MKTTVKTKQLIPIALFSLFMFSCQQEIVEPSSIEKFCIQSGINSGVYTIRVALPDNYDPQNRKYSAIYVLDGDENFDFVSHHSEEFSRKYSKDNALIVCIGYGHNRILDYTPTVAAEGEGGAPAFMDFIQNELIPRMESDFAADTARRSRVILGHSFGGLFAAYAFTNRNDVFGNYLMLSPSLWYDDEILLQYEQDNRAAISSNEQLVFLGIGELENSGRMQAPFEAFYQRLDQYYTGIKLQKNSVSHLSHVGSRNPNIVKSLEFYFQNK